MNALQAVSVESRGRLNFARLGLGAIAIGHRPPLRALGSMRDSGVTHVVTVLSEAEKPQAIEAAVQAAGLSWMWLPLGSTKTLPARGKPEIRRALQDMTAAVEDGGRLYIHCSAGIHRTGMIAAALLFHLGHGDAEVRAALAQLRPVTAEGMGEARLDWARSFAHVAF
jgi:protein-tyrosine phosphatase